MNNPLSDSWLADIKRRTIERMTNLAEKKLMHWFLHWVSTPLDLIVGLISVLVLSYNNLAYPKYFMNSGNHLKIFSAGKIHNPVKGPIKRPSLKYRSIKVTVPARLNTMCFDLKTLTKPEKEFVYNAGELAFSVNASTYSEVAVNHNSSEIEVTGNTRRKSIVRHAAIIMKNVLNIDEGLVVEANNIHDFPHSGLGSSSSLITAVCIAINEMYGKPLDRRQLSLFISQNHGEEIDGDDQNLIHVQCNGGSPSVALYSGGMQIIVGESNVVLRNDIPNEYTFVFGIPKFYKKRDALELMSIETKQFDKMIESRDDFSKEIAWKVLHELIPSIMNNDMGMIGEVIKYYRFETGSLKIDSVTWSGLYELMEELIKMKNEDSPIISVSSCGPAIYALTRDPKTIQGLFEKKGMDIFVSTPNNTGYEILEALE